MSNPGAHPWVRPFTAGNTFMPYRLRDELSFCQVEGYLVFLDASHDRYFRLSDTLEPVFKACFAGNDVTDGDFRDLVKAGVLVETHCVGALPEPCAPPTPNRSAIEQNFQVERIHLKDLVDALSTVCSTKIRLKLCPLKNIFASLTNYRKKHARTMHSPEYEQHTLQAADVFRRARQYVPIETRCLIDSLSMARFLAKRGIYASVVIAVTNDPFSAHCWVQQGDLVLNDTAGNASAHTAIRVV